ncbi:hypothetical protein P153DRAFT_423203 [Dothidotthia symphoricarpi CBS 119687]|uniref:Zinc finger PHD-type domain-containing protein n=1 Tax=Dothidotthia symphoricarpi CBS 119687 TaxID=1392245 RepID=A0A6A6AF70_9PLEO|nr:uncharacterized protein P153DRAFT_423203 [Dothidotthia symphoricarpi CBS 119687]KAF2129678.1 hypothetical protein P153DRAFT_423203 [Dothidotthia symphoricarpi CBS 119687]
MVNSLLFRWEDTPGLKHHCGFCERPLSHPGARASCFGTHAEPCHRFHQVMFMRGRGHICHYCHTIDEAHYTRHHKIAEQLRGVYESCSEGNWNIVPSENDECERGRESDARSADSKEIDHSPTPGDTLSSKRDRKDAKRLARAASRSRVITQEEIRYVDSVLHSAEGVSGSEADGPCNPEEIDEIEKHLRFNAHVYSNSSRHDLRKFAQLPDADVDFDAEMERILDTFRISELVKRNTRTRGLQGKELKTFQTLVFEFKRAVVDDLVLVKKDFLEVRMRRAGYLRYTNKTAYGIVEDRYTDKDWKTGERIQAPTSSDSSGITSPADTLIEETMMLQSKLQKNSPTRPSSSIHTPDHRHLQKIHRRINGNDGVHTVVIEPYHAPLLSMSPISNPGSHTVQLKVINIKAPKIETENTQHPFGMPHSSSPWSTVVKATWGGKSQLRTLDGNMKSDDSRVITLPAHEYPDISHPQLKKPESPETRAPAVQAPSVGKSVILNEPEGFGTPIGEPVGHPAVSQKKAKKVQREAKRKAKKITVREDAPSQDNDGSEEVDDHISAPSTSVLSPVDREYNDIIIPGRNETAKVSLSSPEEIVQSYNSNIEDEDEYVSESKPPRLVSISSSLPPIRVTHHGKHRHWMKFTRMFMVDQLTAPCLQTYSGCVHGTTCLFEVNDIPDCPFHKPHCACVDPVSDQCYLIYPGSPDDICSSGPYNRLRGENLKAIYERDPTFKGRIMLADDDMAMWLMNDKPTRHLRTPSSIINRLADMPQRLALEYADFQDGYNRGPLMEQERTFERIRLTNKAMKKQITRKMLLAFQRKTTDCKDTAYMCYCYGEAPERYDARTMVMCSYRDCDIGYFHKSCVKKLGVEKVSHWYCTGCEQQMGVAARQLLRDLGWTDIPDELLGAPEGAASKLKSRVRELDAPEVRAEMTELEAEDVD